MSPTVLLLFSTTTLVKDIWLQNTIHIVLCTKSYSDTSTSRLFELMWYEGILKTIPVMILLNGSSNFSLHHLVWRHTLLQRSQHQGWLLAMGRAPQGVGRLWVKMCCLKACSLHWCLVQKSWRTAIGQSTVLELHPAGFKEILVCKWRAAVTTHSLCPLKSCNYNLSWPVCGFSLHVTQDRVVILSFYNTNLNISFVKCVGVICLSLYSFR